MTDLPIVTRRDLLGEDCLFCEGGRYREDRFSIFSDDNVECTLCGAVIHRFLTKREVMQVQVQRNESESSK
jgi:hypothetical protein